LEGVTVQKSGSLLLSGVTLFIERNEFVGVIGPNGAGKTTLLNVIAGFEKFTGNLSLFGRRETWRRYRASRLRIGYVPQLFRVDPAFPISAMEAVMTGVIGRMGLFHPPGEKERTRAMELLAMMRMDHLAKRPLGQLSGGERQKVSLARAIVQKPDILLLDEPTSNLDIAVQKEVIDLVGEIHRHENLTCLLVTHDFNMLPPAMRRVMLLDGGRLVFDGPAGAAMSGETLSRLFHYRLETFERGGKRFVSYD
jgi:ABC-type Mn2+/Zn2+ transport system ATPase subunit